MGKLLNVDLLNAQSFSLLVSLHNTRSLTSMIARRVIGRRSVCLTFRNADNLHAVDHPTRKRPRKIDITILLLWSLKGLCNAETRHVRHVSSWRSLWRVKRSLSRMLISNNALAQATSTSFGGSAFMDGVQDRFML